MKKSSIYPAVWFFVSLSASSLFAFYQETGSIQPIDYPQNRLIVKINAETKLSLLNEKGGITSIGVASFDAISRGYEIKKVEFLLPEVTRHKRPDKLKNILIVTIPEGAAVDVITNEYRGLGFVEYVELDRQVELYEIPDDSLYAHQYALNNTGQGCYYIERYSGCSNDSLVLYYGTNDADIDAQEVFENLPDDTRAVVVAIIDTGVYGIHPDLIGRMFTNTGEIPDNEIDDDHNGFIDDVCGWDFCDASYALEIGEDNDPNDEYGHGTHCAGIVAAMTGNNKGIAGMVENCRIMPLKFAPIMIVSLAVKAIIYAADNGADVISMSWGYEWPSMALRDALEYAYSKGVILVASNGNDGDERINYPTGFENVISVGASDSDDEVTVFSTYGSNMSLIAPGLCVLSLRAAATDMYGPCEAGVHIIDNWYYLASGTSMSGPFVAGAAAYVRSVSSGIIPDKVREILETSADDITDPYGYGGNYPGFDIYSGYGRLNLKNALDITPRVHAIINSPSANQLLSGIVDIVGSAYGADFTDYVLEYGEGSDPTTWTEIASSSTPVTEGSLASWNTPGLSGEYALRLSVGPFNVASNIVYISSTTTAVADILSPSEGDTIVSSAITPVEGVAVCPDFSYYKLEYGSGEEPSTWTVIEESGAPIINGGNLGNWNSGILNSGIYTLRLSVYSSAGLEASTAAKVTSLSPFAGENGWSVYISSDAMPQFPNYGDFDNDGVIDIIVGSSNGIKFYTPDGQLKTDGVPSFPTYDFSLPIAVGNLDDDGVDDFVAIGIYFDGAAATLYGQPSSDSPFEIDIYPIPVMLYNYSGSAPRRSALFLKDIDMDGRDEIHYYTGYEGTSCCDTGCVEEPAHYFIYDSDGSFILEAPRGPYAFNRFFSADINKDGEDEIYRASHKIFKYDLAGNVLDSFDLNITDPTQEFNIVDLSAVDINFDSKLELLVWGNLGWYNSCVDTGDGDYMIFAFDENLEPLPGWPHDTQLDDYLALESPVFCDINGDRAMEYFVSTFDHASGTVFAWNIDGSPFKADEPLGIFAGTPDPGWVYKPVMVDMNGDSSPEVVACSKPDIYATYPYETIIAWNSDGELLEAWPLVTQTGFGPGGGTNELFCPVIGDFEGDGDVDLMRITGAGNLVFASFNGIPYNSSTAIVPFWRYNRSLNNTAALITVCTDSDGDGYGDPGHPENECPDDNCPMTFNPNQSDLDNDGMGDLCDDCTDPDGDGYGNPGFPSSTCPDDNCSWVYNPDQTDADVDGIGDACDNCIDVANADQADFDDDGIGDACDVCTDTDGDGYGDPGYPNNTCPEDNCPDVYNPDQLESDGDGLADACDNCPYVYNPDQEDFDADGIGDSCDECTDADGDGFGDPGFPASTCTIDNCPGNINPDQEDFDGDSVGDSCDNCIDVVNTEQTDTDGDGDGDLCDNCPEDYNPNQGDRDYDGVGNVCDNCEYDYNPDQEDSDGDGVGDSCIYVCGDVNEDEMVNIMDIVSLIRYLYMGGPGPEQPQAMDVDGSGQVNITDIAYLISYLYLDGDDLICGLSRKN